MRSDHWLRVLRMSRKAQTLQVSTTEYNPNSEYPVRYCYSSAQHPVQLKRSVHSLLASMLLPRALPPPEHWVGACSSFTRRFRLQHPYLFYQQYPPAYSVSPHSTQKRQRGNSLLELYSTDLKVFREQRCCECRVPSGCSRVD
jgi:hypothetical protein